ncbi:protein-disulfide isomerase [Leucobacter komagatae]|uniref:Protein-disulfide isomerase n=1 Tax=Leucobacter komagatae TaxID=55969 RepID=A0A542Y6K7_9MICO|nr:thioredoxin domain-containing protein [Leucobacter komagatae]TQL43729.1 protein-disulfide isomerase [Leucobacter komagatae]
MNLTSERRSKRSASFRPEQEPRSAGAAGAAATNSTDTDAAAESRKALADQIRRDHQRGFGKRGLGVKVLVVMAVVAACAALLWLQFRASEHAADDVAVPKHATDSYGFILTAAAPEADSEATETGHNEGFVPVVLYEDFLCASCGVFHEQANALLSSELADGTISIEYRPFAFLVSASSDEYSQRAANAAVCVADLAGVPAFVTMRDLLFDHQPAPGATGPNDAELTAFAETAGAADAASCITERTFDGWVAQALNAAVDAGVSSTPTVWVDGVPIVKSTDGRESMPGPEELQFMIDKATE